jgi:nitroreductase
MTEHTLDVIRTRRVIRNMTDQPLEREKLESILKAVRWAPVGGNQRVHRFVAVTEPLLLRLLRLVSPGMFQNPQAVILICIDWEAVENENFADNDKTPYIDIGTQMQTMMLAAHSIGVGSGPVTSFSREAVRVILNIPQHLEPYLMVALGYAAPKKQLPMQGSLQGKKKKITWQSLTDWERFPIDNK